VGIGARGLPRTTGTEVQQREHDNAKKNEREAMADSFYIGNLEAMVYLVERS
jgi:hypothetical protein